MSVALAVLAAVLCATSLVVQGVAASRLRRARRLFVDLTAQMEGLRAARGEDPKWLREVREDLDNLTFKADRALREARSREATATHAVRRAREELRESGAPADERLEVLGVDDDELDDDGGPDERVQPVRAPVARAQPEAAPQPGAGGSDDWAVKARRVKFGF